MLKSKSIFEKTIEKYWKTHIPFTSLIELTYNCNLKCSHCYVTNTLTNQELTTIEVQQLLDELAEEKVFHLVLTGGEIFLRDDLFEILDYIRKKGFMLRLFTNGTLITPSIADILKKISPQSVEISIYGANASTHENITGVQGSFESSINAFKLLKEREITTIFKATLMKQNFAEYAKMKSLAEELKAIPRFSFTITARNDGDITPYQHRLTDEQLTTFFQQYTYEEYEEDIEKMCKERREGVPCGAGRITCRITPTGKVSPCVQILTEVGDIRKESFHKIWWRSEELLRLRELSVSDLVCGNCEILPYCQICIGQTALEDGNLTGCCKEAKRIAERRKEVIRNAQGLSKTNH